MKDRTFRDVFVALISLIIILVILLIGALFSIDLNSKEVWGLIGIIYVSIFTYYTSPLKAKLPIFLISVAVIAYYLVTVMGMNLKMAIILSLFIEVLGSLAFTTLFS